MADNINAFISVVNTSDAAVNRQKEKDKRRVMKLIENIKNKKEMAYTDRPGNI
jgi:tellurite resistance protein